MAWVYPDKSLYTLKDPDGGPYWYDVFPNPPEFSFIVTTPPPPHRSNDHFVVDTQYDWPDFFLNAAGGRGYTWHHAELYDNPRRPNSAGSSSHTGAPINPLTPEYNFVSKKHEYPYAEPNAHPDYAIANPLSNNVRFPGFPNLIFSDFRHYIFPTPVNFIGTPYTVTQYEPIKRKSWGGQYISLQRISVWSPYSAATWIDFANENAYNISLEASSIWS